MSAKAKPDNALQADDTGITVEESRKERRKRFSKAIQKLQQESIVQKERLNDADSDISFTIGVVGHNYLKVLGKPEPLVYQLLENECGSIFRVIVEYIAQMRKEPHQEGIYFQSQMYQDSERLNIQADFWIAFKNTITSLNSPDYEHFQEKTIEYMSECLSFMVFFHVEDKESFEAAKMWVNQINKLRTSPWRENDMPENFILIGLKTRHSQNANPEEKPNRALGSNLSSFKSRSFNQLNFQNFQPRRSSILRNLIVNEINDDSKLSLDQDDRFRAIALLEAAEFAGSANFKYIETEFEEERPLNAIIKDIISRMPTKSMLLSQPESAVTFHIKLHKLLETSGKVNLPGTLEQSPSKKLDKSPSKNSKTWSNVRRSLSFSIGSQMGTFKVDAAIKKRYVTAYQERFDRHKVATDECDWL